MNPALKQRVVRNVAWLAGLVAVVGTLVGGSILRLRARQADVSSLESEIQSKRDDLERGPAAGSRAADLAAAEATLLRWQEMTGSESLRIDELTSAARSCGVTLTSLKSADATNVDEDLIARSHRVRGVGGYRQLALFLDAIYASRGMAAIDELEIFPETDAGPGVLQASLRVTWLAPDPDAPTEEAQ